jgi:hypothetical protein
VFADQVLYPQIVSPSVSLFLLVEDNLMKYRALLIGLALATIGATSAVAQEKGVDAQSKTVRDSGNNRAPANNGAKQDVGTAGSGINFGKDKTKAVVLLPNPYRLTARRDVVMRTIADVMRDRKLILDEAASKPDVGIIVSQPYTFIKGTVVAQSELNRFAEIENSQARGWTRGRYTITVEVQPIDGTSSNISVNAKIEGRSDGPSGAEWITLQSKGTAEQDFLNALIDAIGGGGSSIQP